ncbi:hypothetical protein E1A91_A10G093200v1 [Gossypium mustelinum]|uniref:Uncharacterized protein n=1 Tax=Gossypium mustelinum TaxID=34275 RepID=A0A5D2XJD1_GOSMU|nr:hypothetical protein E1A91_A10G093200v1 [Gossypium mustelinum]
MMIWFALGTSNTPKNPEFCSKIRHRQIKLDEGSTQHTQNQNRYW